MLFLSLLVHLKKRKVLKSLVLQKHVLNLEYLKLNKEYDSFSLDVELSVSYVMWSLLWAFNGLMAPSAAPSLHRSLLLAKLQFGVARAIGIMINTLLGGHCNFGGEWTSKLLGGPKFGTRPVPGGMVAWPQAIESKHISGQQFAQLWQKFAVVCIKCSLENGECRLEDKKVVAGPQKM